MHAYYDKRIFGSLAFFHEARSSSVDTLQDADLLSMYGKNGSTLMQTAIHGHLSPCQQQANDKSQPGSLRNMFAVSSTTCRVKSRWVQRPDLFMYFLNGGNGFSPCIFAFRFFAKESVSGPPDTRTADKSGLAVLDDFDKEGMTPGSLDSGVGESIGGSQLDTENEEILHGDLKDCSSAIMESHSVKKRLVFDVSNGPSSSKRLRLVHDLTEKSQVTDGQIMVCIALEKTRSYHLMNLQAHVASCRGFPSIP